MGGLWTENRLASVHPQTPLLENGHLLVFPIQKYGEAPVAMAVIVLDMVTFVLGRTEGLVPNLPLSLVAPHEVRDVLCWQLAISVTQLRW